MERRKFLERLTQLFSFAFALLTALPAFRFFSGTLEESKDEPWYPILRVDAEFLPDRFIQVSYKKLVSDGWIRKYVEEYVWVRKKLNGNFVVFSPRCTHLGCAFAWNLEAKQFQCPCHGGIFDMDGSRVAGPPPRPLDRFETKIENNILKIGRLLKA